MHLTFYHSAETKMKCTILLTFFFEFSWVLLKFLCNFALYRICIICFWGSRLAWCDPCAISASSYALMAHGVCKICRGSNVLQFMFWKFPSKLYLWRYRNGGANVSVANQNLEWQVSRPFFRMSPRQSAIAHSPTLNSTNKL